MQQQAQTLSAQAQAHQQSGRVDLALPLLEKACAQAPGDMQLRLQLALCLEMKGDYPATLAQCDAIIASVPANLTAWRLKAHVLERTNQVQEARKTVEAIRARWPKAKSILLTLAQLERRDGKLPEARALLEQLLETAPNEPMVHFELGKVLDKQKEYDAAFAAFARSQALTAATPHAKAVKGEIVPQLIARSRSWFTQERVAGWKERRFYDSLPSPVIFAGFPRSGTTLMEQILASHPDVLATQEQLLLDNLVSEHFLKRGLAYPDALAGAPEHVLDNLRTAYWRQLHALFGSACMHKRVVDKKPLNLTYLGMVNAIFPDAKILIALRDPRDAVLSCFMQHFQPNEITVHMLSLEKAARFYAQVMGLWLHFRDVLSLEWMEYRYEDLVADTPGTARRVLDFLGLPWNEEVLGYYKPEKNRNVTTPSYEGVMKPTYQEAAGRWRHYARHMEPALPILQPFIEEFGYAP